MESIQKQIICVLLDSVFSLGLLSKTTYFEAKNLLYLGTDFSEQLW